MADAQIAEPPAEYADFRHWLAVHDAEVARQQAEKDAQIAERHWFSRAAEQIAASIREQFNPSSTPKETR